MAVGAGLVACAATVVKAMKQKKEYEEELTDFVDGFSAGYEEGCKMGGCGCCGCSCEHDEDEDNNSESDCDCYEYGYNKECYKKEEVDKEKKESMNKDGTEEMPQSWRH